MQVRFDNTAFVVPFDTVTDRNLLTIENYATDANQVELTLSDDEACQYFQLQRTANSDQFADQGTYSLESSTEVVTNAYNEQVRIRVAMPNETVFENVATDGRLSCGVDMVTSRGAAEDLILFKDDTIC